MHGNSINSDIYNFIDPNQIDKCYTYNQNLQYQKILSANTALKFLTDELPEYLIIGFYIIADGGLYTNNNDEWKDYEGFIAIPSQDGKRIAKIVKPHTKAAYFCSQLNCYIGLINNIWSKLQQV
ncbi:hypothetical protein GUI12_04380 [Anaplasmataceae bacterium AB001_6]|nr:hypothetical protein GUI12_04380 [Anaplasmataceae bacterium AB001_6]